MSFVRLSSRKRMLRSSHWALSPQTPKVSWMAKSVYDQPDRRWQPRRTVHNSGNTIDSDSIETKGPRISPAKATTNADDPSAPMSYGASRTALLLLDFQNLVVNTLGEDAKAALAKAKMMREWALSNDVLVVHSIIDVEGEPRSDAKGHDRFPAYKAMAKQSPEVAQECVDVAADTSSGNEVVVLKQLGLVSGLRSKGAMALLKDRGIRSLVICGLSTSGAALRTAIGATDEGFVVTVIEDGCADREKGLHDMLMKHVIPMTAHVVEAQEFIGNWQRNQSS